MEKLASAVNSIKFPEKVLMGVTFVALLVRFIFHYQPTSFLEAFTLLLALVYCPFGFYFLGKPSPNYSYRTSVILGIVYAISALTILINAANIDSYQYTTLFGLLLLIALVIYLLVKLRSAQYPEVYVNAQFVRAGFLILCCLIVL